MADTIGPFDGSPWAEAQWARNASVWAASGVLGAAPPSSTSTGDLPLTVSGLSVGVGAGRAWVYGFGFERTGAAVMQAVTANNNASNNRIDRLVLRRDLAAHTVTVAVLTGTPAVTPVPPSLARVETGTWEVPLYSFVVPPNSGTTLTAITDERAWVGNPSGPPVVAGAAGRLAQVAYTGLRVRQADTGAVWEYDGSTWSDSSAVTSQTSATRKLVTVWGSGTTPPSTNVLAGDEYLHTTFGMLVYDGAKWITDSLLIGRKTLAWSSGTVAPSTSVTMTAGPISVLAGHRVHVRASFQMRTTGSSPQTVDAQWAPGANTVAVDTQPAAFRQGQLQGDTMTVVLISESIFDVTATGTVSPVLNLTCGSGPQGITLGTQTLISYTLGYPAP